MLYFIPAWYKDNRWAENEQKWHRRRLKSEFDETIKQITLFHRNVDVEYKILSLGFSPNFRHFLHRQGMYRSNYWSCFDAIAQIRRRKVSVFSYHDIKWPKDVEFIYTPFAILAMRETRKYAQIEFGEDGNPISIDMYQNGKIVRKNYYDDRGFVSSTVVLEGGKEIYQDYLMESGVWKFREYKEDGHIVINPNTPYFDIELEDGFYDEVPFLKREYANMEELVSEVTANYLTLTRPSDTFFVAIHPFHMRLLELLLTGKKTIATFFENRFPMDRLGEIQNFLTNCQTIITDAETMSQQIAEYMGETKTQIVDIPPYDARMDFGISSQLNVQNIFVPIDGLADQTMDGLIEELCRYLSTNELARVHIFTRNATWGVEDWIKNRIADLLSRFGYDKRWLIPEDDKRIISENDLDEEYEEVEQRFFIDICVEERAISKVINEQRVILDLRGIMDVYTFITAISKGVPRIALKEDQFLADKKNGCVISDVSQIPKALSSYLDNFENWNKSLVACYEISQAYTTSVLLGKWRKVLGISDD